MRVEGILRIAGRAWRHEAQMVPGEGDEACAALIMREIITRGEGDGNPRFFERAGDRAHLGLEAYEHGDVRGGEAAVEPMMSSVFSVEKGMGGRAEQAFDVMRYPACLRGVIGCGEDMQMRRQVTESR